jgi:valine dehydrogenase (NAD+)
MDVFAAGHETVVLHQDARSGLRCIVAVYSTALGPALGGTRMQPYPDTDAALADVLALSKAMAYKNALADLPHGGGKAVIVGDPTRDKSPELLQAYGEVVESLGGRYITACDVGTYVHDMDVVAQRSQYVTGRSAEHGGAGDSGVLTAFGVYQGMRACAQHRWGDAALAGRRVGVAGLGKVGRRLVAHLHDEGAQVVVADPDPAAVAAVATAAAAAGPTAGAAVEVVDPAALLTADLDIYSPNALGGAIDAVAAGSMRARVVCGGANNPLTGHDVAQVLLDRGVTYAPDYLVNAGGVIQVADERHGFDFERARAKAAGIFDTTLQVLQAADQQRVSPLTAADRIAEARMADGARRRNTL